jgi:FkbM family methyltransferase
MSYYDFIDIIDVNDIKTIFELGSRDLIDAIKLADYFEDSKIYSFECNPDCLIECHKNICDLNDDKKKRIFLIEKAISINNGNVLFYPFDLQKCNNMGASSMLKIDFSLRDTNDPDYNRPNVQKEITVDGVRLDTFVNENNIENIDLLCIDLQGYELNAIKSLGDHLHNVKYIITECSIKSTYTNGSSFEELNKYLNDYNFKYIVSNKFGSNFPNLSLTGFSEFDALFINTK